jgi:uncharacterized MnhB-related membrane protein
MFDLLIVAAMLVCAWQAVRGTRLLIAALWLAGASALAAVTMYRLGAPEVAVIELSVGAGLVTVLFVFAINIAGEEPPVALRSLVPWPLAALAVLWPIGLAAVMVLPALRTAPAVVRAESFATVLWEQRGLDAVLQVVLIVGGVLAVLGLLAERRTHGGKESQ